MTEPIVSVIVPVYNVALYLDKCISSIVKQSFTAFEVIIVDDGSTDSCPQLCDLWQERDSRIRVIHQANLGLPGARRTGVRAASGKYVLFVDSDDWIASSALDILVHAAESHRADVVYFDYLRVSQSNDTTVHPARDSFPTIQSLSGPEALRFMLDGHLGWNIWRMLISASILKDSAFSFPIGVMMGEDLCQTYQVLGSSNKVWFEPCALYYYFDRPSSSVNRADSQHRDKTMSDLMTVYSRFASYIDQHYPSLAIEYKNFAITQLFSYLTDIVAKQEHSTAANKWKQILRGRIISLASPISQLNRNNLIRVCIVYFNLLRLSFVSKFFYDRIRLSK